jgi:Flp pilus assembly protein TadB
VKDYKKYVFTLQERLRYALCGAAGSFVILYLFYQNVLFCIPASGAGAILYMMYQKKQLAAGQRWKLMLEFKDAMDSFVSALTAGYSMENAVTEAYRDLQLMYGKETAMLRELRGIRQQLTLHKPLDGLFLDLGRRSGLEDIITFAQIYSTARRSGGNLVRVMRRTAGNISGKVEIEREIQTAVAGKKMEAGCMMAVPLLILLYLQIFSPDFLAPLYCGLTGRMFMTAVLLVYAAAVMWSRAILRGIGQG